MKKTYSLFFFLKNIHHFNPQNYPAQNYYRHILKNYRNVADHNSKDEPEDHADYRAKIHPKRDSFGIACSDGFDRLRQITNHSEEGGD